MIKLPEISPGHWSDRNAVAMSFVCGFCGTDTTPTHCYLNTSGHGGRIYICTRCGRPTAFISNVQYPMPGRGKKLEHLPPVVESMYEEARATIGAGAIIATALTLRVILFRIAADRGITIKPNDAPSYKACISFLVKNGDIAPTWEKWVDPIRVLGNLGNHELGELSREDVEDAFDFIMTLLEVIYVHPGRITARAKPTP